MKLIMITACLFIGARLFAQDKYWQQHVSYTISTELNDKDKTLTGVESIVYTNNSPATLNFIWFHIWPNAYKG
ncbi:MAG: hypothetical protein ABIN67_03340 [Ferruginibacter sp.]